MGLLDDIKSWTKRERAPFTAGLIASLCLSNLYFWLMNLKGMETIAFTSRDPSRFWTFLTYPWAYLQITGWGLLFFVFLMLWLVWIGMPVERDIGTSRFAVFWFVITVLGAVAVLIAGQIVGRPVVLLGPELPVSALTVTWCTRNPTTEIRLWGILPLTGKWLGWICVGATLFGFGLGAPLVGVFACIPLALGYLFASNKLPHPALAYERSSRRIKINEKEATTRGQVRYDDSYFDEVRRREQERAEREKLKKLFGDDSES